MKKYLVVLLAFVVSVFAVGVASASTIGLVFDTQFSNSTNPAQTGPWAGALFNDNPIGGLTAGYDLRLTIFTNGPSSGLTGTEFLTETDFNIAPLTALNSGQFSSILVSATNGALGLVGSTTAASFGFDAFQADGDGKYDMTINFSSNPPRATTGNIYVIDIAWSGGVLLPSDFGGFATPGGGNGPFRAATHIQGIVGGEGSTWAGGTRPPCINCATPFDEPPPPAAVPEPGTMVLMGTGLLLLASRLRRKTT